MTYEQEIQKFMKKVVCINCFYKDVCNLCVAKNGCESYKKISDVVMAEVVHTMNTVD